MEGGGADEEESARRTRLVQQSQGDCTGLVTPKANDQALAACFSEKAPGF